MVTVGDLKKASYTQNPTVAGTWYTALNLTGTSGYLHLIRAYSTGSAGQQWVFNSIKITIDGGETITISPVMAAVNAGTTGNYPALIPVKSRFTSSLKIELTHSVAGREVHCDVIYSEDQ